MAEGKRVIVTGATGLIGKALCKELRRRGYTVVVFSRYPDRAKASVPDAAEYIAWQPAEPELWATALDGAYAVINLAGASIGAQRWSASHKRRIRDSRIEGTRSLVSAMAMAAARPQVLVNASGVGYYGYRDDTPLDESAAPGQDFLARVCAAWEHEATAAEELGVRVIRMRSGIVLAASEGALPRMALPVKLFVGGPILPGTQWLSWIHLADAVLLTLLALEDERVRGPLNATAPHPQTNRAFIKTLAGVLHRPALLPVPGFALRMAVGEMARDLIHGQRAVPAKAQELGYEFRYPTSEQALRDLLAA